MKRWEKAGRGLGIAAVCGALIWLGLRVGGRGGAAFPVEALEDIAAPGALKLEADVAARSGTGSGGDEGYIPPLFPPEAAAKDRFALHEGPGEGTVFFSTRKPEEVARYYRDLLSKAGWREISPPEKSPEGLPAQGASPFKVRVFMGGGGTFYLALAAEKNGTKGTVILLRTSKR